MVPSRSNVEYGFEVSPGFLWQTLDELASVPEHGRGLFAGTLAERNVYWRSFASFVRQAKTYWMAAESTNGSASALNYYYCFLQLAKAELLRTVPVADVEKRTNHGLTHKHSASGTFAGEKLTVVDGVFPKLYAQRTGLGLPLKEEIQVNRLLLQIPEIGVELVRSGLGQPKTFAGMHAIVWDGFQAWPILCFPDAAALNDATQPVFRLLHQSFEEIDLSSFQNWRDVFAMSRRLMPKGLFMLQSRNPVAFGAGPPDAAITVAGFGLFNAVGNHLSDPVRDRADFMLSLTLTKTGAWTRPMPAPLARYALIYWLSSVVRYRPRIVDRALSPDQAWLADAFAMNTPLFLLEAAVAGILKDQLRFQPSGYRI